MHKIIFEKNVTRLSTSTYFNSIIRILTMYHNHDDSDNNDNNNNNNNNNNDNNVITVTNSNCYVYDSCSYDFNRMMIKMNLITFVMA